MIEPLQTYTIVVTRTHTAIHEGCIHVVARTPREAEVMAQTLRPKRWRRINESTEIRRALRE